MIEKISVSNWMAYDEFEAELKHGKNLIYGCNAAGKSSLAKALAFNLTGYLSKKIDPRRDIQEVSVVDLIIKGTDNKKYLIRRQINKGSRIKDTLFIYDVKEPSEAIYTDDEADDFLQKMFGISKDIFERIIYMKEEDVHEFLAKPDGGVLFEIDRLIGLDKAHKLSNELDVFYRQLKGKHSYLEKERKGTETAVRLELGIKDSKTDIKKAEKRLADIAVEIEDLLELRGFLEKRKGLIEKISEIKQMAKEQDEKKLETKLIENQLAFQKEKTSLGKTIKEDEKQVEGLRLTRSTLSAKKDLKDSIMEVLDKSLATGEISECPTCGREMDEKLAKSIISKLKDELKAIEKDLGVQISQMESLRSEISKKEGLVFELDKKIKLLQDLKQTTGTTLFDFNANEGEIKRVLKKGYPETLDEISAKLDALEKEASELDRSIGRAEGAQEVTAKMVEIKLQKEEELKHKMKIVELIEKATEETTKKLRETYTAEVKNLAEEIWKQYKGETWHIEWDRDFVPIARALTSERDLSAYEMSGSEKFLIMLAIRLAIQQSLEQFQLLIIDEPCQHLDETNGRLFRDILTSIDEEKIGQSIVFTYNQDFLDGKWANVVKLS